MIKFAFVFPGQGSQSVGMLRAFADVPVVQQTLREASVALGEDVGRLIEEGPAELLNQTAYTQPAMLAAGVAVYRAWIAAGGAVPRVVAGHSLGEFSALVAAGVMSFQDAIPLVRIRAQAMQEAVPIGAGAMAAILGLTDEQVIGVCAEAMSQGAGVVEAVNFNAPSQVVIAGAKAAVERACEMAKAAGAKRAVPLPVSAPFHSSLLQPASVRLGAAMVELPFYAPLIPVINNVDVHVVNDPDEIKRALVRQAAAPVRWAETVRKMAALGVTHVIECGPGKVLSGLTRRIDGNLVSASIVDPVSLQQTMELLA